MQLLHTNGLYAAEDALVRELENRYPEQEEASPTESATVQPFLPCPDVPEDTAVTFDASAGLQPDDDGVQEEFSLQSVQDRWCSP